MQLVGILETTNSLLKELIEVEKEKPEPKLKLDPDKMLKGLDRAIKEKTTRDIETKSQSLDS